MGILINEQQLTFHLQSRGTSYILQIHEMGFLTHLYWGRRLQAFQPEQLLTYAQRCSFHPTPDKSKLMTLDTLPQEYPVYGTSDFRQPAYGVKLANGTTITELLYVSHTVSAGKPELEVLPATYVEDESEAETLEITTLDKLTGLKVILSYTVFSELDAITRSVRFVNEGTDNLELQRALSANVDFPHKDFDLLHLAGAWAKERNVAKRPLTVGTQSIESRRGSSSHQHNPFLALMSKDAGEEQGDVYGFSLVYSGNFLASVEVDAYDTARVSMGINPFDFSWLLEPGQSFQTPEAVLVYSPEGLGGMSRRFHKLYRTRLCRGLYRDEVRPVLVNNWEATYFNFNAEKIEDIAKAGKELGIELFVLDDGWFGKRDSDNSSLGDWIVDRKKLPNGLEDLVKRVRDMEMQFGLWFEPEMVSPDSDLYRAHPDWCLHVPGRRRTEGRQQLILDFSRKDVCDYIIKSLSDVLSSAPITYVKWDMNRNMTEIGSALLPAQRQRETAHRYMLGLYRVLEEITTKFPHILFESCSGGGGRFDPGMLYYMPQTWTSDNTDAISRLKIQYGTSMVYPISSMGSHVSAVPNHQVHRMTSLDMRGNVAMSGNFGYELDLTQFTEEEKSTVKAQVAFYKEVRSLVQQGDFYRLLSPFEGNETAWMFVSEDQRDVFAAYFRVLAEPNDAIRRLRFKGLDPNHSYKVAETGQVYGGDVLMYAGLVLPELHGDYQSAVWRLQAVE
ncbi:alpha-galactosidase [Paenibacillus swuensis]|uniref:Alpha-galactosidase n=1 Tax=Paenibacillus swuensis TaxID=1178515 RepID=A0A172TH71_9BACL|nr:alpha-galactosidase [Paenibacillus swuensis]ANE46234.1 alpha-galactosidase [Paenibacillus swuensis]